MDRDKRKQQEQTDEMLEEKDAQEFRLSETWAQDALADLDDWIEEQGIYIRQ